MTFSNFSFLETEFPILFNIGLAAEFNLHQDPVTCLFKLRQFGERLTDYLFEEHHLDFPYDNTFHNRIKNLELEGVIPIQVKDLLNSIKHKGNIAVHQNKASQKDAEELLFTSFKIDSQYQIFESNTGRLPQAVLAKAFRGELVAQEVKEYEREIGELGMVAEEGMKTFEVSKASKV